MLSFKKLILLGIFAISACAVVQVEENSSKRSYFAFGPVRIAPAEDGTQVVQVSGLGVVASPGTVSVGVAKHRIASFPDTCGAVFVEPDETAVERIAAHLPGVMENCTIQGDNK